MKTATDNVQMKKHGCAPTNCFHAHFSGTSCPVLLPFCHTSSYCTGTPLPIPRFFPGSHGNLFLVMGMLMTHVLNLALSLMPLGEFLYLPGFCLLLRKSRRVKENFRTAQRNSWSSSLSISQTPSRFIFAKISRARVFIIPIYRWGD